MFQFPSRIFAVIKDTAGRLIGAGNPFPVAPSAFIHSAFVDEAASSLGGFSGTWQTLLDDTITTSVNSTATNPKVIDIYFKQIMTTMGIGVVGSVKNTKITAYIGTNATVVIDNSADATVLPVDIAEFNGLPFTRIVIEFYTADTITLNSVGAVNTATVVSQIRGIDPDGASQTAGMTVDGNLAISDNSSGLAIAKGDVTGVDFIHKFGKAPDFDIADGFVTIWDAANDAGSAAMQYTYSTSADIDSLSSSNSGDTQDIEIEGLDTNYDPITQIITLTGQTRVALTTDLIRVFRMTNAGSTDFAGTIYCYVNGAITLGVPDDVSTIRAEVNDGLNQTLMAIYTIPNGKTGYMRDWYVGIAGAQKTSSHVIHLVARPFGGVFLTKHASAVNAAGTSHIQHKYEEPEMFDAKTDIEMQANTDANVTAFGAGFDIVLVDI